MKARWMSFGLVLGLSAAIMGCATLMESLSGVSVQGQTADVAASLANAWMCRGEATPVDDLTTGQTETYRCELDLTFTSTNVIVRANGIPNHDYESTFGCCATEQDYTWTLPLHPTEHADGEYDPTPERGAIAVTVTGVAIFGPEDGPGGDAVALDQGLYVDSRQPIDLGVCGGHAGPGGVYHYHWDANCLHHHGEAADYHYADLESDTHSEIVGFAFDGYPIYGLYGYDADGNVAEMTSSYRLKAGATGYNGSDDWEYVEGLGDLDACNGHVGPTPEVPEGMYHYHTTRSNGAGGLGYPYFIGCYHGVPDESNFTAGGGNAGDLPPPGGRPPRR